MIRQEAAMKANNPLKNAYLQRSYLDGSSTGLSAAASGSSF